MKRLLSVLGVCAFFICAVSAHAATWKFNVFLDGLQEVSPNASPGYGDALALLDDSTGMIDISGTFSSLIGTSNNAHLHGYAPAGINAAAIFPLTYDIGVTSGSFSGSGSVDVAQTLAGNTYINVHSTVFLGGEIRGQLINPVRVPEPATLSLAGFALLSVGALRRRFRC